MAKGILWKGKYFALPQAASSIDSSALSPVQLGGTNRVALLADFVGLVAPKTAVKVGSSAYAEQLIAPGYAKGDEAVLAANLLFGPSPSRPGASEVLLVPVNSATQSTLTLDGKLTLTSYLYGLPANQLRAKVEAGTISGKKITIEYAGNSEPIDNLGKTAFSVQYVGTGTPATMTIALAAGTGTLTTSCTGAAADDLNLDFTVYDTIQKLVDAIQANGKYVVTNVATPSDASVNLDTVADASILTATPVTADLYAIVAGINAKSGYATAVKVADAGAAPADSSWAYFAGATYTAAVSQDWTDALDMLKAQNVDIILPLTSTDSVHAAVSAHCTLMSGVDNKKERRGFVGGANLTWTEATRATNVGTITANARALNSDRIVYTGIGTKHYAANGVATLYPGYITAAMYAGIAAGAAPSMPLTRKYLNCIGLETELRPTEITDLIEAGVAPPIPDSVQGSGYLISRQVTTWSQDNDLYRIEYSVGRGADYVASQVRARHELLIGEPGTEQMDATIINLTNGVLEAAKRDGYIRDYDPKATQLRVVGTVRYIDYSATPVLPINWILSTYHLQPVSFVL